MVNNGAFVIQRYIRLFGGVTSHARRELFVRRFNSPTPIAVATSDRSVTNTPAVTAPAGTGNGTEAMRLPPHNASLFYIQGMNVFNTVVYV